MFDLYIVNEKESRLKTEVYICKQELRQIQKRVWYSTFISAVCFNW